MLLHVLSFVRQVFMKNLLLSVLPLQLLVSPTTSGLLRLLRRNLSLLLLLNRNLVLHWHLALKLLRLLELLLLLGRGHPSLKLPLLGRHLTLELLRRLPLELSWVGLLGKLLGRLSLVVLGIDARRCLVLA